MAAEDNHLLDKSDDGDQNKNASLWSNSFQVDRQMLKYKGFYICFMGATATMISFLPLHMKQLGLSPSAIGIASAFRPICGALSVAVAGTVSDRIGYRRAFLMGFLVIMIASEVLLASIKTPPRLGCQEYGNSTILKDCCEYEQNDVILQYVGQHYNQVDEIRLNMSNIIERSSNVSDEMYDRIQKTKSNCYENGTEEINGESLRCLVRVQSDRSWQYNHNSVRMVFIEVLIFGSLFDAAFAPSNSIADASAMATLLDSGRDVSEYGKTRGYGQLAWDLGAFTTGMVLQFTRYNIVQCGVSLVNTNYVITLIPFSLFMIGSLGFASQLQFSYTDDTRVRWQHLYVLFTPHYIIIILAILFFGVCNGAVWGFLYWHLQNMGASHWLLGFVVLFEAASDIPAGHVSSLSVKYLGYWNSFTIGFIIYTIRFIWIYLITNPWWIAPFEFLNGFAFCQTWNVLLSYISSSVPSNLFVTVCALCSALYFGLGVGLGYVLTGYLVEQFGGAAAFGYYGIVSALLSILFAVFIRVVNVPIHDGDNSKETHKTVCLDYVAGRNRDEADATSIHDN